MTTKIQSDIIKELGISPDFDADTEMNKRINFLQDYLVKSNLKSFVLGISGGIDSTTAGMLAQKAVNRLRSEGYDCKFIAVRLPYGEQADEDEAQAAINAIKPDEVQTVNIKWSTDELISYFEDDYSREAIDFHKGNIKARMRMISQYAIAGLNSGLVIGTDHGAEALMGFFTKFGDGAADILPLSGLNKRRVRALAAFMGVDAKLVNKTPTADLEDDRPQRPDEDAYGVTYDQIDDFLEGKSIDEGAHCQILEAYWKTQHKRNPPITL